jgi:multidrug efflux pump subunit AcrA (membrane-fusion protein)
MKDKRVIGSVALAIVLVVVLIISVIDVIRVRSGNLVATVQPFEQLDLNFSYSGTITSLPVASGERVKEGQILAVESVGPISQKVSANEATVAADEANLASLVAPTLPSSEASTLDLKVSQAQQAVQASQSAFNNITSAGNQLVSQYRTLVSSAQAALSNDQSLFQTACPNGVTSPPSTASVSSGQSTLYATCLSLSEQVANDQKQLSQAQAELSSAQAQVINDQNQATAALQNANSQLGLAQNGIAVATAKGSNAQIQSAKAQLANDQAQLAYDESILSSLMLRAPVSGVVEDVNGNIGGVVGSSGVSQYYYATTPQGASSQSGGLNSVESGVTNSSNSTKNALVVLDVTSRWYVTVDVPQSELDTFAPGSRVTISLPGVSGTFTGKVGTFEPIATQVNGQTYYEVRIDMKGAMPKSVLPGMTGSATVG